MRIPLSVPFKTRTGAPDKDAKLKNAYTEVRRGQSIVRKRPIAQGGVSIGTGTAQGGIGLNIAGTDYIIAINGDSANNTSLSGATAEITPYPITWFANGGVYQWSSGTSYAIGDFVDYVASPPSDPFSDPPSPVRYYATLPSTGVAITDQYYWSTTPTTETRYQGTFGGYAGSQAGSDISAAYSAWLAYPYNTCATRYGPTQQWVTLESLVGTTINGHQWVASEYSCSGTILDQGVGPYGTVSII